LVLLQRNFLSLHTVERPLSSPSVHHNHCNSVFAGAGSLHLQTNFEDMD